MTAYRQHALACAAALAQGPRRPRDLTASVPDAPKILHGNVYGWFARVERGVYSLTKSGRAARNPATRSRGFSAKRNSESASFTCAASRNLSPPNLTNGMLRRVSSSSSAALLY